MELYNLSVDPREDHDVSAELPDIVARMWNMAESSHEEPSNPNFFYDGYSLSRQKIICPKEYKQLDMKIIEAPKWKIWCLYI
jgi:hypothetical protein